MCFLLQSRGEDKDGNSFPPFKFLHIIYILICRSSEMSFPTSSDVLLHPVNDVPPLEESYTINLGISEKILGFV